MDNIFYIECPLKLVYTILYDMAFDQMMRHETPRWGY